MKKQKGIKRMKKQKGMERDEPSKFKGLISDAERQFLMDMSPSMKYIKGAISEEELRKLMNTMNTMGGQPIRGMNSERRKDLLKPSKFRR